jgi:DNA-binding MarR family transcriptional regulator
MCGTRIVMTEPAASPVPRATLDALDEVLVDVRRVLQRPGYRRRLLAAVGGPVELASLRVLRAVERAPSPAPSIGDVAEVLAVDPSTASRTVDRCVAAGHLTRRPCPDDRRRSRLELTAEGRAVLARVTGARRELLAEVTAAWDPADLARLADLLATLVAGFDQLEPSA